MLSAIRIAKTINGPNDTTHVGEAKVLELQDVRWGRLKSQEQLHLLRSAEYLLKLFESSPPAFAWAIANANGDRWRCMGEFADGSGDYVDWTADPAKALLFARRADAEAFARDDEDAWRVERIPVPADPGEEPHKRPVARFEAPGATEVPPTPEKRTTEPRCLPVDKAETDDVLRIFRQFVNLNATQWTLGSRVHPIWAWLAERIESEENKSGPDWQFIQPDNRKTHAVLVEDFINAQES